MENRTYKIDREESKKMTGFASIDKPWLKYYKSLDNFEIPRMTIYDSLKKVCLENSDNEALYYFGTRISYGKLLEKIDTVANAFLEKGVKKGDVVSLALPNIPENTICIYALNKIGAMVNSIDLTARGEDLIRYLNEANSQLLVASDVFIDNVDEALSKTFVKKVIVASPSDSLPPVLKQLYKLKNKKNIPADDKHELWFDFEKCGKKSLKYFKDEYSENNGIIILHTSGTTGIPKGVVLTNENFNAMYMQYENCGLEFKPNDKFLNQVPPFLAYNIVMATHLPFMLKMRIVMLPDYQPSKFAKNVMKYKINHVVAGPADWNNFREKKHTIKDVSYLKTLASGSDKMDAAHKNEVNEILRQHNCQYKVIEGYGQTEGGCADSTNLPQCYVENSVGIPLPQMTFCIYDNEADKELKYDEEGEICIYGPTLMKEYYNNSLATSEALRVHSDGKLWLHTGDLGKINKDGVVFVTGRLKRIIVRYDGIKVSPFKIENIIKKNPNVEDCCVVGIFDDENERGAIPIANIVLKKDTLVDSTQILLDIEKQCKSELGDRYLPREYLIQDKLPLTQVGKIDYRELETQNYQLLKGKVLIKK